MLTVPSLEGDAIEDFGLRVAEAWRIGQQGVDNGAILIVAPNDRRARIEVGYGLEGVIPDAVAARILRDAVFPRFRQGDFAGGLEAGVDALAAASRGEIVPARRPAGGESGEFRGDPLTLALFIGLFVGAFAAPFGRRVRSLGAVAGGGIAGTLAFLLMRLLPAAVLSALVGAFVAGLLGGARVMPAGGRRRHRGGYGGGFGGGWGGGGGGWGGGGGGGFGGGGGGFGGGGASGSW